jgi:hypothetical protein
MTSHVIEFARAAVILRERIGEFPACQDPAPVRRRHTGYRRRQPLAGADQRRLLGFRRPVRWSHRCHDPARADRSSTTCRRSAGPYRQLLRADRARRFRSRCPSGQSQQVDAALVCRADARRCRCCDPCDRRLCRAPSVVVAPAGRISEKSTTRTDTALSEGGGVVGQAI